MNQFFEMGVIYVKLLGLTQFAKRYRCVEKKDVEMKPKLFISYSRRQTPFVDRLADKLEDNGYSLWLDYQSLVPAKPWLEQIESGLNKADVLILVVSKESLASDHVKPEWQGALKLKKRIILLIFEAIPLPLELQACEWVDFRSRYNRSIKQLMDLLENPIPVTVPAPQKGFKAPVQFWIALVLSLIVVIGSFPTWWTLFIPYILLPLPWQIYKKNYIFSRVIPALLLLPLIFIVTWAMFIAEGSIFFELENFANTWFIPSSLASWLLAVLLLSPAMQRRAKPEAARVRFANPLRLDSTKPRSIAFAIDHAPEDAQYAADLRRGLERHGHRLAGADETPEAIFVLISGYKKRSSFDPDRQAVFPIVLQAVKDIDPALQRIQWINFRKGIHNINKLAKLLPEPERLLKVLATAPAGAQEVFPFAVNALQYFYLITGILAGGGLLTSVLSLLALTLRGNLGQDQWFKLALVTLNGLLLLGTVTFSVRVLRSRTGGASAFYPLLILTIFQMAIHFCVLGILVSTESSNENVINALSSASSGSILSLIAFPLGLAIITPILVFRWRDLYRWLPRRQGSLVSRLERILLLYTPSRRAVLFFHVIFHALLLLTYLSLIVLNSTRIDLETTLFLAVPFLLVAFGIRWWARRMST